MENKPRKKNTPRIDQTGVHERLYKKNKAALLKTGGVCAICGEPIDKALTFPNPMSASIDHIIPIAKGGHPSALDNLQLTHLICNQLKGTKETIEKNKDIKKMQKKISNKILPLSYDWKNYRAKN